MQVHLAQQSQMHADFGRFDGEKRVGRDMPPTSSQYLRNSKQSHPLEKKGGGISSDLGIRLNRIVN